MLKNIKSSYFIQLVYTYVEFAQKLKLIKYNKYLQNLTGIHFSNYKYFSGKYIIYESNGIGKEYDGHNDILIYEGEYLNGQRNGKGKEYYDYGPLKFEGEYTFGYKLKGKLYINNNLEYEGEYLYDKKWNGKGYDENGNVIYELINGNGKVKEYNYDGIIEFEGEYLNGKRNGKGKEYNYDGTLKFEGEYLNGKRKA